MPPPAVLVVEDDPTIARALVRELKLQGFQSETAPSASAARGLGAFSVAIVDIHLSDGNGIDLVDELVEADQIGVAIFFSATDNEVEKSRARCAGMFIAKSEGVSAVVEAAVRIYRRTTPPRSTTRPSSSKIATGKRHKSGTD